MFFFFPSFVCFLALIERPLSFLRRAELAEAKKRAKTYKERKKHDRFDGMPEEEVSKRVLPDHLTNNLDIIIVSGLREGTFPLPFLLFFFCFLSLVSPARREETINRISRGP